MHQAGSRPQFAEPGRARTSLVFAADSGWYGKRSRQDSVCHWQGAVEEDGLVRGVWLLKLRFGEEKRPCGKIFLPKWRIFW